MLKEKLTKKTGRRIEWVITGSAMLWLTCTYPLMWSVFLLYIFKEIVCEIAAGGKKFAWIFRRISGANHPETMEKKHTGWYDILSRTVTLLVLFLLLVKPDIGYFKANIMMSVSMVLMGIVILCRVIPVMLRWITTRGLKQNDLNKEEKNSKQGRKRWKKAMCCTCIILGIIVYYLAGILISGMRQPGISEEYKNSLNTADFYGDAVCGDRATIFEDNEEALTERVRLIRNANERVILSTFDFRDDASGRVMLAALLDAAGRGVQVKVVVDGVSGMLRMGANPYFMALSTHPNAEIRIYNKINLLKPWALMGRLHDKYVIADDTAYFLGGRNTFSYFLGATDGHINYDRDIFVYNAAKNSASSLYQVEAYFEEIWNSRYTKRFHDWSAKAQLVSVKNASEELKALLASYYEQYPQVTEVPDYTAMTVQTEKITLLANPTTIYAKEPTVFYALSELMAQAKENVTIHTPYLICNRMMYDAFSDIAGRVPEMHLMTNSAANNGNPFGSGDYTEEFENIIRTGMTIYEYEGGVSYHGKSIAIDDDLSVIGSFNMDMRSVYLDTELMLVVDSTELNTQLREIMNEYQAQSGIVNADGTRSYPDGVVPQVMSREKQLKVRLIYTLLGWARRLL